MEGIALAEMTVADIPQVLEVERRSFPTPWSKRAFTAELTENVYAHYIVVRDEETVVGYGGMWLIIDEAHVTNIAVHPRHRGRRLGELLLSELERRARDRGIARMTLEVRPSNHVAQELYRKHGFVARGRRPGYYTDTREDAIIMWKEDLREEEASRPQVGASGR